MEYYQIIKGLREDNDLTQKQVADYLHTSKNAYYNYENGLREIPFSLVVKLAKKYKVSMDYIGRITNDKGGNHKIKEYEQELIDKFNKLNDIDKGRILQIMENMGKND